MIKDYGLVILVGVLAGFLDRWVMLHNDYRHYPTYPHGHLTHLTLGLIAAGLGAVAVPALAKPDFVAITFLSLAAQQFREIRNIERQSLAELEHTKLIKRGSDYIEGIAKVFEARNYLCMLTALISSGVTQLWNWPLGVVAAGICILFSVKYMSGKKIGDIASVSSGKVCFEKSLLMVEDVVIMNVGLPSTRKKIMDEGIGVIIHPNDDDARLTLDNPGQRMAIIHDLVSILGSKVEISETELMPLARKNIDQGYLALFIVANEPDIECVMEIIKRVPVLESAQATSLKSFTGRKAAD